MMVKVLGGVAALAALAVALLLFVRWWSGDDLVSGRDPQVTAALIHNPGLSIRRLPESWGIHEVVNAGSPVRGYFALARTNRTIDGEVLTGALRMGPCDPALPDWLPLPPAARDVACIVAETDKGERHFVSFRVDPSALPALLDFYEAALRDVDGLGSGARHSEGHAGLDWKGRVSRSGDAQGRRVEVLCDSARQRTPAAVVVIGYQEALPGRDATRR